MSSPTIKPAANVAIVWGSDNGINAPAGALIETISVTPKNAAPIEIEGNNGFAAALVGIRDGFDAKVTCVYDTGKTWPKEGDVVTIVVPKIDGNAGTTTVNTFFWSWGFTRGRKNESKIELNLTNRPDIN